MNETITANINNAECIIQKSHFGYDAFHNICSGSVYELSWSIGDWVGFGVGFGVAGLILFIGFLLIYTMFNS